MRSTPFVLVFCLVFGLFWLGAAPVSAEVPLTPDFLRQALAGPEITVGNFEIDKDGLNAFYGARDFRPAWDLSGAEKGNQLSSFLGSIEKVVAFHGLIAADYPLQTMHDLAAIQDDDSKLKLELLVTDTLLRLAHNLHGDDIDLNQIYVGWKFHRSEIDIPVLMQRAVASDKVNELFEQIAPQYPAYKDLAKALALYREISSKGGWQRIDPGPRLKSEEKGVRVEELYARLKAEGYLSEAFSPDNGFDEKLSSALMHYQRRNGLTEDGHLGEATISALNIPLSARLDQISANMERWRHMPDDFPPARSVLVNIADASIEISENGSLLFKGPVIVGKVDRKTPFIDSVIKSMIINPSWHVPAKIARADILPKLREDPHYLEKLGFVIRDSEDDPHGENIDWKNMADEEFNFRLRQAPGEMNSLGRLKFDFANDYAVYLHGTPHQELFSKDRRTLSSGCVRLADPAKVAEILLTGTSKGTSGKWTESSIMDAVAAKKTRWIGLAAPIPVEFLYWTVFKDEMGEINFRTDVYDYDHFLMQNMRPSDEVSSGTP